MIHFPPMPLKKCYTYLCLASLQCCWPYEQKFLCTEHFSWIIVSYFYIWKLIANRPQIWPYNTFFPPNSSSAWYKGTSSWDFSSVRMTKLTFDVRWELSCFDILCWVIHLERKNSQIPFSSTYLSPFQTLPEVIIVIMTTPEKRLSLSHIHIK